MIINDINHIKIGHFYRKYNSGIIYYINKLIDIKTKLYEIIPFLPDYNLNYFNLNHGYATRKEILCPKTLKLIK